MCPQVFKWTHGSEKKILSIVSIHYFLIISQDFPRQGYYNFLRRLEVKVLRYKVKPVVLGLKAGISLQCHIQWMCDMWVWSQHNWNKSEHICCCYAYFRRHRCLVKYLNTAIIHNFMTPAKYCVGPMLRPKQLWPVEAWTSRDLWRCAVVSGTKTWAAWAVGDFKLIHVL